MRQLFFPEAVNNEDDFYGRRLELTNLQGDFPNDACNPRIINGGRRMGKTSLLKVITARLARIDPDRYAVISLESAGVTSLDTLVGSILSGMAAYLPQGDELRNQTFHVQEVVEFDRIVSKLASLAPDRHFIIALDEFDEVIRNVDTRDQELRLANPEMQKILKLITLITCRGKCFPFTLFVSMTQVPPQIEQSLFSAFSEKAFIVNLAPLSRDEMIQMVKGILLNDLVLPPPELERLYQISGGIPYFAKLVLEYLVKSWESAGKNKMVVTPGMFTQCIQQSIKNHNAFYAVRNIYKMHLSNDERRVLLMLTILQRDLATQELVHAGTPLLLAANKLVRRQYVSLQGKEYSLALGFLGDWLRNWPEYDEEIERLGVNEIINASI